MPKFPIAHHWEPIGDLLDDHAALARPELDRMLQLWQAEKASLRDPTKAERLQARLATRWAIETGVLERLYTIDRGTTETLVDLGLEAIHQFSTTARLEYSASLLIEDQKAALDFIFDYIKDERPLSLSYIKELHQLFLRHQDTTEAIDQFGKRVRVTLRKGEWKLHANNPLTVDGTIHEYCPPDFVNDEMEALLRWHHQHQEIGIRPEVEAAWLHHRFTQIHPFQDGNGRIARALATMVFMKAGFLPLVIRDAEHRDSYIDALEHADRGDLQPLISLFSNILSQDLDDAITFVRDLRGAGIQEIARAAAEASKRRIASDEVALAQLRGQLLDIARYRLEEIAAELRDTFNNAGVQLDAYVQTSRADTEKWWRQQIVQAAREYQYFADLDRPRPWVQLRLGIKEVPSGKWHIVVSFHHKDLRADLMAVVVFLTTSETGADDSRPIDLGAKHEFTCSSTSRDIDDAFRSWLETALTTVLQVWQTRL